MEPETKGFIKGLKEFLEAIKETEKIGQPVRGTGEFGGFDAKVKYRYTVKTDVFTSREPAIDILDRGDKLAVSVKLPGKGKDLSLKLTGNTLEMEAKTPKGVVKKSISIEKAKKIKKIESASFKKGVLTIILSKKQGEID